MFNHPPKEKEWISWLFVLLFTALIFLTIPLARRIQQYVDTNWGRQIFGWFVIFTVSLSIVAAVVYLFRHKTTTVTRCIWLIIIAAVYIKYTIRLMAKSPEEAIHFIQYGLLGLLIYRALLHRHQNIGIYFVAAVIGGIIGTIDEAIQWAIPRRYWDLKDIWLNFVGTALMQVAIAKGIKPHIVSKPISRHTIRQFCRVTAVALLLLGGSFSNTPKRIAWYSEQIPFLSFLQNNPDVMFEYGYLYEDPEIGIFRSRLSPEELLESDLRRRKEAAEELDASKASSLYEQFLEKYTPVNDPFMHEARVHLFRRDRYMEGAEANLDDLEIYRHHLTVAFRENQIMEKYFHHTLHSSTYVLLPEQVDLLEEYLASDPPYDSPVSGHLITRMTEEQIAVALLLAFAGIFVLYRFIGKEK